MSDDRDLQDEALAAVHTLTDYGARYVLGVFTFSDPEAVIDAVAMAAESNAESYIKVVR